MNFIEVEYPIIQRYDKAEFSQSDYFCPVCGKKTLYLLEGSNRYNEGDTDTLYCIECNYDITLDITPIHLRNHSAQAQFHALKEKVTDNAQPI